MKRCHFAEGLTRNVACWQTYAEVYKDVLDYGLGLAAVCGLKSGASGEGQV